MIEAADLPAVLLHDEIAADVPQLRRGLVWCVKCGRSEQVNGARCLQFGWPRCCGATMTIDSPEERIALARKASTGVD